MPPQATQIVDIVAMTVFRILARRKQGLISDADFAYMTTPMNAQAVSMFTTAHQRQALEDMFIEEIRKAIELMAAKSCPKCRGRGFVNIRGVRHMVCRCISLVHYRGDKNVELGDQWSNQFFEGDLSKDQLGKTDIVMNLSCMVALFLG